MQKLLLIFLLILPNYLQAQEFENVLWWKPMENLGRVRDVAISPNGEYFISLTDKLQMWNANNGDFIMDFEIDNYIKGSNISFSKNGEYVFATNSMKEGDFAIWYAATGKIFQRFNFEIDAVAMSNDSKKMAFLNSNIISIYNIETKELIASRKVNEYIKGGISYSPDNKYIVYGWSTNKGEEHGIYWLDANTLETYKYMPQHAHEDITSDVAFSRDGKYMFLFTGNGSYYGRMPTTIYTYPNLTEVIFKYDKGKYKTSNFYISPISKEVLIDLHPSDAYFNTYYIVPLGEVNLEFDTNQTPPPFYYLRDADTSGKKMPGYYPRLSGLTTIDTIGVFLPLWNTTKVKEKTNNNEDKIYPNPSTNSADIAFALDAAEEIKIMIYDNSGRLIETLHSGLLEEGEHTFSWNCSNVSSGKYICNIRGNSVFKSLQVVVAR